MDREVHATAGLEAGATVSYSVDRHRRCTTNTKTALHSYLESAHPAFRITADAPAIVVLFRHGPPTLFSRRSSLRRRRNAYTSTEPRTHAADGVE